MYEITSFPCSVISALKQKGGVISSTTVTLNVLVPALYAVWVPNQNCKKHAHQGQSLLCVGAVVPGMFVTTQCKKCLKVGS